MGNSKGRMNYLETYRQQLRHETDAMGYGQLRGYVPTHQRQARSSSVPSLAIIALALLILGVVSAQV